MRVFWGFRLGEGRRRSASARTPSRCAHRDGRWLTSIASIPNVFIGSRVRWRSARCRLGARGVAIVDDPGAVCPGLWV